MQRRRAGWGGLWALCAALCFALSLTAAPVIEAVKHGPGATLAAADHRALHAAHGDAPEMPGSHHEAADHDHISAAVLASPGAAVPAPPERTLRPESMVARGTIRDGPRRPPRLIRA